MDTNNTIYANAFRIAFSKLESQLLFRLETPIFDETNNDITGASQINVADIRLHPTMAKELYIKLKEQLDIYEKNFGEINPIEETN